MKEETSVLAQAGHRIAWQDKIILDQAAEISRLREALETTEDELKATYLDGHLVVGPILRKLINALEAGR